MRREAFAVVAFAFGACAQLSCAPAALAGPHDALIAKHAAANGLPEHLVRRVIRIESRGNAASKHAGNYGLMQIRLGTARGMGYLGQADGLLDPDTNLTYAVRYLAGAYRAAGCDADLAVSYYQRGYYGAAKRECGAALPASTPARMAMPADVIKPKVVRTETIATAKSQQGPARPVGKFEPERVAPPPAAVAAHPRAAVGEGPAAIELVPIPMPPVRPVFAAAPKQAAPPTQRAEPARKKSKAHAQSKVAEKSDADSSSKTESKFKIASPTEVVTFLKKLVTPDKKPGKRGAAEAEADPPSQAQPPQ